MKHGFASSYGRGCRCDLCRAAETERQRAQRQRRRDRIARGEMPTGVAHGLSFARNWGCKCDVCRSAVRAANANATRRHGPVHPSPNSEYRLLAVTCRKCGALRTTPDHLIRKDSGKWFPPCRACKARLRRAAAARRDKSDSPEAKRVRNMRYRHNAQARSLPAARKGAEYTSSEMTTLLSGMSAPDLAHATGRTYYAVRKQRAKLLDQTEGVEKGDDNCPESKRHPDTP